MYSTIATETNTVQTLVTSLSAEGVQSYVALIMDSFSSPPATPSQESEEYVGFRVCCIVSRVPYMGAQTSCLGPSCYEEC